MKLEPVCDETVIELMADGSGIYKRTVDLKHITYTLRRNAEAVRGGAVENSQISDEILKDIADSYRPKERPAT